MSICHWNDAPPAVRAQVADLLRGLQAILGEELTGLYLHGSLAMGCFNPARSDIDLLAVTRRPMTGPERNRTAELLLTLSGKESPIEISFLTEEQLHPWRYPTPFDLHYSESWRERFAQHSGRPSQPATDPDLAAHLTIIHRRGIVLVGPPVATVFPPVPTADYLSAIWEHDGRDASRFIHQNPVYGVLNHCRVLAYLSAGPITSKAEGGEWGLLSLPSEHRPAVAHALALYRGDRDQPAFDPAALSRFAIFMEARIEEARIEGASHSSHRMACRPST